jgi:hypothetical protein
MKPGVCIFSKTHALSVKLIKLLRVQDNTQNKILQYMGRDGKRTSILQGHSKLTE